MKEHFLYTKLQERIEQDAYRQLRLSFGAVDFCSNDYLGIVTNGLLRSGLDTDLQSFASGSTGSRLLTGNYGLIEETEKLIADFHDAEAGLIFNSGYDANFGLLSCIAQKGDTIIYDFLCHASIRDGIRLSFAKAWSFLHNNLNDLERKIQQATGNIFIVTESVFSMDGDVAPLIEISDLCATYGAHLIVDEAHATGIIGPRGEGLVQHLGLQARCLARIHTFGKALGCHGAIVLGSDTLRNYLINFCRPFIYSTALPETSVDMIKKAYSIFPGLGGGRKHLQCLIDEFQTCTLKHQRLASQTPIQGVIVPGNSAVKQIAERLHQNQLDVRPVLYPTVPKGSERLRIILHAFNTHTDLHLLIRILST